MPATPVASAPQPTRLNLNLPATARQANSGGHSSVREQALNDPRSRGQHTSAETRMAQTLGSDDTLTEEDMGNGRRRFRKGAACVDVHDTRIAHLNPFDAVSRDIKVAKPCD